MTKRELKEAASEEIEKNRESIIELARSIQAEPEEGFKEYKTARKVAEIFSDWGIRYQSGLAITGVKGYLQGEGEEPLVGILGEMDALFNPEHPEASKNTGLIHACGHFAQVAGMIAAGFGLKKVIKELHGGVVLFAVPAEECIHLDFRKELKAEGRIKYYSGKQELIRLGAFDDIDIVMMSHAQCDFPGRSAMITEGSNGFVSKLVKFIGREAHAGIAPFKGINALNAFNIALCAIHAQRETFRDRDSVRVHMITTKGGESVNIVPSEVRVEVNVRARNIEALRDANAKVDRALRSGALGVGAGVEIDTTPGYLPFINEERLLHLWIENATAILGPENIHFVDPFGGSTDMGDLTHLKPGMHPFLGGYSGGLHSRDFRVEDEKMAFLTPGRIFAETVIDLLYGDAEEAKNILSNFEPKLTQEKYFSLQDSFTYNTLFREE